MIYSLVDLGSNTVRLSVYQCDGKSLKVLFSRKVNLGLAGYVQEGLLSEEGIYRAISVLKTFQSTLDNLNLGSAQVFATASLRNIKNRTEATEAIQKATGITIDVISGEDEARYSFIGTRLERPTENGLVVDIGGGSAEITLSKMNQIIEAISIPIGSLNQIPKAKAPGLNRILMSKSEHKRVKDLVQKALKEYPKLQRKRVPIMVGVGGSIRAAGRLNQELYNLSLEERTIQVDHIKEMNTLLIYDEAAGLETLLKVAPDRVRTQLYGMTILQVIAKHFHCEEIFVSRFGVREGYLVEKLLACRTRDQYPKWEDPMDASAWERFPELNPENTDAEEN